MKSRRAKLVLPGALAGCVLVALLGGCSSASSSSASNSATSSSPALPVAAAPPPTPAVRDDCDVALEGTDVNIAVMSTNGSEASMECLTLITSLSTPTAPWTVGASASVQDSQAKPLCTATSVDLAWDVAVYAGGATKADKSNAKKLCSEFGSGSGFNGGWTRTSG